MSTTTTPDREKIIDKLRKLMAKAASADQLGNEEEAATFAAKAQEWLVRHELTMDEVQYQALADEDPLGTTIVYPNGRDYVGKTMTQSKRQRRACRVQWQEDLASAVCHAYFCQYLVHSRSDSLTFIGRKSHREIAEYVFTTLVRELRRLYELEYRRARVQYAREDRLDELRGFKDGYKLGFIRTVRERLREQAKAARAQAKAETSSFALIRLDNAAEAVERYKKEKIKTVSAASLNGTYTSHEDGVRRGSNAGRNVDISGRGLRSGGGSSGPKLLGGGK